MQNRTELVSIENSREEIISFLNNIPYEIEKPISVNVILKNSNKFLTENITSILLFLQFFNSIKIVKGVKNLEFIIPTIEAYYFIKSLTIYLENNLSLIASWENIIKSGNLYIDEILNWGNQFLYAMERNRVTNLPASKPITEVQIILILIKAKINNFEEPQYLLKYDIKRLSLQLPGSYIHPEDKTEEDAVIRLLNKNLSYNFFTSMNCKSYKYYENIITNTTSIENGVYTKFNIYPYTVELNVDKIKLESVYQWVSLEEIKKGITKTGMSIRFPTYDLNRKVQEKIYRIIDGLPLSLNKIQPQQVSNDFPTYSEIYTKLKPLINDLISKEESEILEFKSSARWDYKTLNYNK